MARLDMDRCVGCDDAYRERPVAVVSFRDVHGGETFVSAYCEVCVAAVLASTDDYDNVVIASL